MVMVGRFRLQTKPGLQFVLEQGGYGTLLVPPILH